ncbi:MAG: hypothetical protein COA45_06720 [Zetaproteobacteria bacterium]|nr:MAG: hypothetical protein COA45_06720 [Zetaproteobacteria bacterium]
MFLLTALAEGCATITDSKIGIFGHLEEKLKQNPEVFSQWRRLVDHLENEKNIEVGRVLWGHIILSVEHLRDRSLLEKARGVNDVVNAVEYGSDTSVWSEDDYWATPLEFMMKKRRGDCEDYAITKYLLLKELGVEEDRLRIVSVSLADGRAHAVLVMYTDDDTLLLDNLSRNVISTEDKQGYRPIMSINSFSIWTHSEEPYDVTIRTTSDPSFY